MELKEYIVTLHRHEDLEGFYEDMETPGGSLYIPDREVNVSLRRPISRNTNYMLTNEEAELIKRDERVWDVVDKSTIPPRRLSYIDQSNNWDKRPWDEGQTSDHKNWALLRCTETENRLNWGSDDVFNQTGSISVTGSGKNVDIIIADGLVNREHVEFLDSEGQSRVKYYNWYQHTSEITEGAIENGTYPQPLVSEQNNYNCNHATHVAGTAAGNNYGWARDANIYNIVAVDYSSVYDLYQSGNYVVYDSSGNFVETTTLSSTIFANHSEYVLGSDNLFDYIRLFHRNKPINPETGLKNPTIVNASFGRLEPFDRSKINRIQFYNGTAITVYSPLNGAYFTDFELEYFGIISYESNPELTGTISINTSGSMTGSGTLFQTELLEGSFIIAGLAVYQVTGISDDFNATVTEITDYGIEINPPGTPVENLIPVQLIVNSKIYFDSYLSLEVADIEDLLNEGIIYVGAASNDGFKMVNSSDPGFQNAVIWNGQSPPLARPYMRGSSLVAAPGVICVGAIGDTKNESKASNSNTGNRVDIYSPGTSIMSSVNGPDTESGGYIVVQPVVDHPDDSDYKIHKYRGTSMAAPQVTGVLACHLETNPRLSPSDALDLIVSTSLKDQITDTGGGFTDQFSLQGGPNRYLYYKKQRETEGYVTAQLTNNVRKPSGMLFPRRRFV